MMKSIDVISKAEMKNQTKPTYLKLFSHCVLVRGLKKGAIYDLYNNEIYPVPNSMVDFIEMLEKKDVNKVYTYFKNQKETAEEYINFIVENDLGFYTCQPKNFLPLETKYNIPAHINEANIEFSNQYSIFKLSEELNLLNCKMLEVRLMSNESKLLDINNLLVAFSDSSIRSILIILNNFSDSDSEKILSLIPSFKKLSTIILCSSSYDYHYSIDNCNVIFTEISLPDLTNNEIPSQRIIINYNFFMEAQKFNPYYNKKIAITENGDIKNSLILSNSFGNIHDKSIIDIVSTEAFKELWNVNPDRILNLKDSHLRYSLYLPHKLTKVPNDEYHYYYENITSKDYSSIW